MPARLEKITPDEIDKRLDQWSLPNIPELPIKGEVSELTVKELEQQVNKILSQMQSSEEKAKAELITTNWLYNAVRANVKRGRLFRLGEVLNQGYADCLGYTKLLTLLGRKFGLDIGTIEVTIDNRGRYVPHYINLVRLADGRQLFPDLWYGSSNITHLRIGVRVKRKNKWELKDIDWGELKMVSDIDSLPQKCVSAITYYVLGNRHLEAGIRLSNHKELDKAIKCYNQAIKLYPQNARFYFNQAVCYENKGRKREAISDYAQALQDESSQIRVLARQHEEIVNLIELDERDIPPWEQEIYLLRNGFITGTEMATKNIAQKCGLSEEEVKHTLPRVEAKLKNPPQYDMGAEKNKSSTSQEN